MDTVAEHRSRVRAAVTTAALLAENADLQQRLAALEAVALELIAERDRAVAELERLSQMSLVAEPA